MSDAEHVPSWVPEIAPGVHADVYPVSPPRTAPPPYCRAPPELALDRHAVTAGYAERRQPYEFASCLPPSVVAPPAATAGAGAGAAATAAATTAAAAPPLASALPGALPPATAGAFAAGVTPPLTSADLAKLRAGVALLRRSRPTKLQRIEMCVWTPAGGEVAATAAKGAAAASAAAVEEEGKEGEDEEERGRSGEAQAHADAAPPPSSSSLPLPLPPPSLPPPPGMGEDLGAARTFPMQKPAVPAVLEEWFNRLGTGAGAYTTANLARSVPLGPAIARATGKVLEMLAVRSVPTQRAAWYVRVAVLNECFKQRRPDRPHPSPTAIWTRQLCALLKTEVDAIRAKKTAILGAMDRVAFWEYVLDLARWQADEGLLDLPQWLSRVTATLCAELLAVQSFAAQGTKIAVGAARRFLPEYLSTEENTRRLLEALLPGASCIVKAWRHAPGASAKGGDAACARGGGRGGGGARKAVPKRPHFTPNLCHREVTMMLSAAVRSLGDEYSGGVESETRMSDLERFVKRGIAIVNRYREADKGEEGKAASGVRRGAKHGGGDGGGGRERAATTSVHDVMCELERLPSHGDVSRVVALLRSTPKKQREMQTAVETVCDWAVRGPAGNRAEAACIAAAVIAHLASTSIVASVTASPTRRDSGSLNQDIHKPHLGLHDAPLHAPLQREIWHFLKTFATERKPASLDKDKHVVRFVAHLCRTEQLSLRVLVRDVSRLSYSHPSSAYLVRCLALLPDPVAPEASEDEGERDAPLMDCRRPLLRKFGYVSGTRAKAPKPISEQMMHAVFKSDTAMMLEEASRDFAKSTDSKTIVSTVEAVRLRNLEIMTETDRDVDNRLSAVASFFLLADEPGALVEWLWGNLSRLVNGEGIWGNSASAERRDRVLLVLVRRVEEVARQIAASGLLEEIFLLMKQAWLSTWASLSLRKQLLLTAVALTKRFAVDPEKGASYWSKMTTVCLQKKMEAGGSEKLLLLALACVRAEVDGAPPSDLSVGDVLASAKKDAPLSPDADLTQLTGQIQLHGVSLPKLRASLSNPASQFSADTYLAKGFTANEIFGTIFIPALAEALDAPTDVAAESQFARFAVLTLEIIDRRQNDVRFQGVRPLILLEFIALILTGCVSGHADASVSLEVLIGMAWVWKTLAASAGINLAEKLRNRVDHYCEKIGEIDPTVLSALLFNMVTRFSGDSSRDEGMVAGAIGVEPFGMVEMQLALLATHRRECGEDEEFGSRIQHTAVSLVCEDTARTLASVTLQCCAAEESRHIVAGLIGYGAGQAMGDSLSYVVKGLTVEAPKNSALHRERALQWYQADTARRAILDCVVDSLSQEVGVQVETLLFDQLASAVPLLTLARSRNCMPSSLLEDGQRISDSLECRLQCVVRSQRTPQSGEVWSQRATQVANLLRCAVPLLRESAVAAASEVLALCVRKLEDSDNGGAKAKKVAKSPAEILAMPERAALRGQLKACLRPVLLWVEGPEQKAIADLVGLDVTGRGDASDNTVSGINAEGEAVDNWTLVEGYGRGGDEKAAIPPAAFGRQDGGDKAGAAFASVVQLKRTYTTFSSLAV